MNGNSKQYILWGAIGIFFMICGILANPWVLADWISFSGSFSLGDTLAVLFVDIIFIASGAVLFWKRNTLRAGRGEVFLLLGTLVMLLMLSEIGARVFDVARGYDFLQNKERAERPLIPFRIFGWDMYAEKGSEKYIISRHGERYPLEKPENTFRIVALGGSTTQNLVGDLHYPKELERLLQEQYPDRVIEVINAGNSGYATPHIINLLALDVVSWSPDLIIVSENVNDLIATYFPDFKPDYSNKYQTSSFLPDNSLTRRLFGWSRLYWIIKSRGEALSYRLLEKKGGVYIRRSYGTELPQESKDVYRRNLETIAAIARANDIPLILGSQPLQPAEEYWDRHMRYKAYNGIAVYPLHEEFVLHHDAFNDIMEEVARKTGTYFVDNNAIFAGDKKFFTDFVHYTQAGLEQLAQNYFNVITRTIVLGNGVSK